MALLWTYSKFSMKKRINPFVLGCLFIGLGVFGGYHLVRIPIDMQQQSGLGIAHPCFANDTGDCIQQIPATAIDAIYHRRAPNQLVVRLSDGSDLTISMAGASLSTLWALEGTQVSLNRWDGTYVWIDTSVGRIKTADNPGSQLVSDSIFGVFYTFGAGVTYFAWRARRRTVYRPNFSGFPLSAE